MKKVFKEEHVGLRVYDFIEGTGSIVSFTENEDYPVGVIFENGNYGDYTEDGYAQKTDVHPLLSFKPFKMPDDWDVPSKPDLKIDDVIEVWDECLEVWKKRHFYKWFYDYCLVFNNGCSSKTNESNYSSWYKIWRLPK